MMVLDEEGQVQIYITKHGVFQGKEKSNIENKKDNKFFSLEEDKKSLFPDQNKTR